MASGVKACFTEPVTMTDWMSADMAGIEISIRPKIQSMEPNYDRAYCKAQLLRIYDKYPAISLVELANRIARSYQWCSEVLTEALRERKAEEYSWLVESM